MDILHIDMWPTKKKKKMHMEWLYHMVGHAGKIPSSQCISKGSLLTKNMHLAKDRERERSICPTTQARQPWSLPESSRTKNQIKP